MEEEEKEDKEERRQRMRKKEKEEEEGMLQNISLRRVTFVYDVEYLFNVAKFCCILLCCICLSL